jgi:hypothetical protein
MKCVGGKSPVSATWKTERGARSDRGRARRTSIQPGIVATVAQQEGVTQYRLVLAEARSRTALIGQIRNAFEAEMPPSDKFLGWLLEHPEATLGHCQHLWPWGQPEQAATQFRQICWGPLL